ncbi:MAG: autotransporter-associated beta strand repeat-containing protein [Verrucomicrobium sp.]
MIGLDDIKITAAGSGGGAGSSEYWLGSDANLGGDGTWVNTGGSSWSAAAANGGPGVAWDPAKTAVFGGDGSPSTVTVSGVVEANKGIRFEADGYTIQGSASIELNGAVAGDNTIAVDETFAARIDAVISNSTTQLGFIKAGLGTLVLGGVNTFTGNVTLAGGKLQIDEDVRLGNVENDLVFSSGTLSTTGDMTLAATRNLTGSGGIEVASGTTLTVEGNVNMAGLTLSGEGTLDLTGATRTVTALSFLGGITLNASGTDPGENVITVTTIAASNLSGTAMVNAVLNLGTGIKTVDVGAGGVLQLNGLLSLAGTGTNSLSKSGLGVLALNADNSVTGGLYKLQIGSGANSGGVVRIGNKGALGQTQTFLNFGAIEASVDLTGDNAIATGISIGSSATAKAILGDQSGLNNENMEFKGAMGFFQSGEKYLEVYNTTTFSGDWVAATTPPTGFAIGGSGKLIQNGNATALFTAAPVPGANNLADTRLVDSVTLQVNNNWGSDILVQGSAILEGGRATSTVTGLAPAPTILGNVVVEGVGGAGGRLNVGHTGAAEAFTLKIAGSLTVNGTLEFDIYDRVAGDNGTANADLLVFTGDSSESVVLSGVIQVNLASTLDAGDFQLGDAWRLIDWGSVGTRNVNIDPSFLILPELSGIGYYWDVSNFATTGYIVVAPEPSRAVLMLLAVALLAYRRKRSV